MSETETGHGASIRKRPMQKRAQERVERILAVATQMIAEAGSDQLRMSDVAARAGISLGGSTPNWGQQRNRGTAPLC